MPDFAEQSTTREPATGKTGAYAPVVQRRFKTYETKVLWSRLAPTSQPTFWDLVSAQLEMRSTLVQRIGP